MKEIQKILLFCLGFITIMTISLIFYFPLCFIAGVKSGANLMDAIMCAYMEIWDELFKVKK